MAKISLFDRRRQRVRTSLRKRAGSRPRLSVHRSGRHIYAQVIDDVAGKTLASASTIDKDVKGKGGATAASAQDVGRRVYSGSQELPRVRNGLGITIVSTPRGVLSDAEAREQNVGGEVLAEVF